MQDGEGVSVFYGKSYASAWLCVCPSVASPRTFVLGSTLSDELCRLLQRLGFEISTQVREGLGNVGIERIDAKARLKCARRTVVSTRSNGYHSRSFLAATAARHTKDELSSNRPARRPVAH